jgi:hypothetical protein
MNISPERIALNQMNAQPKRLRPLLHPISCLYMLTRKHHASSDRKHHASSDSTGHESFHDGIVVAFPFNLVSSCY